MNGSCGLSRQSAERIARKIELSDVESEHFVTLVEIEHSRNKSGKIAAQKRLEEMQNHNFDELDLDRFSIISDWYHFAILELTDIMGFKSDSAWISKRLGIPVSVAEKAIHRLLEHGLLTREADNGLKQTHSALATPSGIPSREVRKHHSQILRQAEKALESVPVHERDFSASTMAIDSRKIKEAQQALKSFRRKFCKNLQEAGSKDRIYCLAMQLFPLDKN